MRKLSMTLVFEINNQRSDNFTRFDENFAYSLYSMSFGRQASISESSIRTRLIVEQENLQIKIDRPMYIVCFNYQTLKHEFYRESNFEKYLKPDNFRFPVNFKGSSISELIKEGKR